MAAEFNMNSFLSEYKSYNNRQYTAAENGQAAMEERDIERAREATQSVGFLGLTLSEKLSELGVGKRVVEQIGDTAKGLITDIVNPLTDWLEKYENIFDERVYNAEMQAMGKQTFFAKQALELEAKSDLIGQIFVYNM